MNRDIESILTRLGPSGLSAVEISGCSRAAMGWGSFRSTEYPEFDLLAPTSIGTFDVVICEQVLEHVTDPWQAMRSLVDLCAPGGRIVVGTRSRQASSGVDVRAASCRLVTHGSARRCGRGWHTPQAPPRRPAERVPGQSQTLAVDTGRVARRTQNASRSGCTTSSNGGAAVA